MKKKRNPEPVGAGVGAKGRERRGNLTSKNTATPTICQSAAAQRLRILEHLKFSTLTTFEGREKLHIPHVAGRVQELRKAGCDIRTSMVTEYSAGGSRHLIARYSLEQQEERP